GLSGSIDWLIEFYHRIAGLEFNLHDSDLPDITVKPNLPDAMKGAFSLKRVIHIRENFRFRKIPLTVTIDCSTQSKNYTYIINGIEHAEGIVPSVKELDYIEVTCKNKKG
ncbi:MAG: hypothetical protein JNL74_04270, partial [Fibrobacteres bacterium]|nr:hypothetical protein [Fibrobacterota bacterium]